MAVFKQVSIKVGLRKIMADLGYSRSTAHEFPWQDSIEWIAEALGQIGAYSQYEAKEVTLNVADFKAKLPCDFIHLKRILNAGYNQPTGVLDHNNDHLLINNIDTDDERESRLEGTSDTDFDYNIVLDNIITNYKTGTLTLQYLAMPIDEEGFPVIPDNDSYKEAFFWKVARQLSIRGQLKNKELTYERCDREWQWYCGQARSEGNAFTHAQIDKLSLDHLTFFPLAAMTNQTYDNGSRAGSSFTGFLME